MARILLTLALAVYNNVANLWPPFNRTAYVPANLIAAGAVLAAGAAVLGLSAEQLGVAQLGLTDAALGTGIGAALAAPLFVLAATARGARLVADRRVSDLRGRALAYQTLIRVPLGTALLEELAFRGVVFAAWLDEGEVVAYAVSSVVFGLWHVAPAATMVRVNAPGATPALTARSVAGTVVVTAAAGAALTWLRVGTGSLAAPFALHATLNSLATLAGALAGRRVRNG
ncbi:MAG TPA: CPBP family glutamic-type intramembrane protease [Actinomycetota bacterium]|nr:CPBP family glutamic-type intramembrane protease [Actinomycetota bacterium]